MSSEIIITKKDNIESLKFILAAASYDDPREFMRHVISIGEWCICTDGKRLHAARLKSRKIPDGVYSAYSDPLSYVLLKRDVKPPTNLIEILGEKAELKFGFSNPEHSGSIAEAIYRINRECSVCINIDYVSDLCLAGVTFDLSIVKDENNLGAIHFDADDYRAVIMPIKL